jgi:hypothetical protein
MTCCLVNSAIARSRIKTDRPLLFLMTDRLKSKIDRPSHIKTDRIQPMQQLHYDWSGDRVGLIKG